MQLVSLKGKVVQLLGVKIQSTSYGIRRKAEVYITDPHASMKLVLWEDFIHSVQERKTYQFNNLRVRIDKQTHQVFLNTPINSGCTTEEAESLTEPCARPDEFPISFISSSHNSCIIGVNKVVNYHSCNNCHKKLDASGPYVKVKCKHCSMRQKN